MIWIKSCKFTINVPIALYPTLVLCNFIEEAASNNTLDIFLKQYFNESDIKGKFSAGDTVQINQATNVFEKGNYGPLNF
jgi:hypothetical protein